jgi:hypothetical protein
MVRRLTAGAAVCAAGTAWGQLYDNGPMLTSPNICMVPPEGTVSQLQLSNTTFGFGMQPSSGSRVADDFAVPAGAGWDITGFRFYGYQTFGVPGLSTFTSVNLRVWSGRPGEATSMLLLGDTLTNRLTGAAFAAIYRVSPMGSDCGVDRPVFALTCTVPMITLTGGTYWVDWQATGDSGLTGPWAVPVTIVGQLGPPLADAMGINVQTGSWVALQDLGSHAAQDLAFQVLGSVHECYVNCDGSTMPPVLNVQDFACFLNRFAAGDTYANCDGSSLPPVLNVGDFSCFLNRFNAGCSA